MENETFQKLNLSHLDFSPESESNTHKIRKPGPVPQTQNLINLPPIGNTSFQTLMAQNEDLVAQLRVTLNRLSSIELLNQQLQENFDAARSQSSAVFDQLLIWKEKSKIWKEKELALERTHQNDLKNFTIEIDILKQKVMQLEHCQEDLARYQKYHEKVKTSVKPYIQKLKSYAKSLFEQTQSLNSQVIEKDLKINVLEASLNSLKDQSIKREEIFLAQKNELIDMFELERTALKKELSSLQNQNEVLIEKTRQLDRSLERQDELENLIVALRRSKEDSELKKQVEVSELKSKNSSLGQSLHHLELENGDLRSDLQLSQNNLKSLEVRCQETEEQLTSLRYLWSQKSQENEKLKMSLNGLEKINSELSQKLKILRNTEAQLPD